MVEFGLKLQHNKVADWSDKYIDYEELKSILERAKAANGELEDLKTKDPKLFDEVVAEYERDHSEHASHASASHKSSFESLTQIDSCTVSNQSGQAKKEIPGTLNPPSAETTVLVPIKDSSREASSYGTNANGANEKSGMKQSLSSSESAMEGIRRAATGVVEYFQHDSLYTRNVKKALQLRDSTHSMFSRLIFQEMSKVNTFYNDKCRELEGRLEFLIESVTDESEGSSVLKPGIRSSLNDAGGEENDEDVQEKQENVFTEMSEKESLRRALTYIYRTGKLLNNYAIMNYTGFVKIIKKFDKTLPEYKNEFKEIFDQHMISEGKDAELLTEQMERIFAKWFCAGDRNEARALIMPKKDDHLEMDWSQLRLGYRLGMCAILTLWVCWDCIWGLVKDGHTTIGGRAGFPVFRACGGLLAIHWFWGLSTMIWSRYRINYIYLFDFNPKVVATPTSILNNAVDETVVFLVCMLLYYKASAHDMPDFIAPGYFPFLLVIYTLYKLVVPWSTRGPLWSHIISCLTAPLTSPTFFDTYVGDVFTSMVKIFQDMAWTICFIASGDFLISEDTDGIELRNWHTTFWYKKVLIPVICLFPLVIRFNQCLRKFMDTGEHWPNMANAFKYAMSQTVTLFGAFEPLYHLHASRVDMSDFENSGQMPLAPQHNMFQLFWMTMFVASSLYSFFWDLYVDWGLGRMSHAFLGPRLMFPRKIYYYGVIFADLILRSMWVLTLVPPDTGASFELPNYLTAVTMLLELFRRTLWGFFRLEKEHRSSTTEYRRVGFVPLHFHTGHSHNYKGEKHHSRGKTVLAEVAAVTIAVIAVGVSSIIAAQRHARLFAPMEPEVNRSLKECTLICADGTRG
eukprot:CAMPEP_0172520016 /NCGR_PEP_ID=MMETSP1066-20121228/291753_1 /TAXON_ID=671091 /ORGANISM="Coscinodiscus wailesii, Strain CCMP2513" /LENGTH=854 /DNA_ID=CAMNT_0013302695 /DNA_START=63 /DNA_END=2627 /DNA_ORIENTATION=-